MYHDGHNHTSAAVKSSIIYAELERVPIFVRNLLCYVHRKGR
jgi:hypothetical protein